MAEPEEVVLEAAHVATTAVAALWRRHTAERGAEAPALADLRGRLRLFVTGVFGDCPEIVVAEPPARPTLLARLALRTPSHLVARAPVPSTDGRRIRLPRRLDAEAGVPPERRYRLLALEQAARAARGAPSRLPPAGAHMARDLFELAEAAAVDRWLARHLLGLAGELAAARRAALEGRPPPSILSPLEAEVERRLRALLSGDPAAPLPFLAPLAALAPGDGSRPSRAWASTEAARLEAAVGGAYRGVPPVLLWGRMTAPFQAPLAAAGEEDEGGAVPPGRTRTLERRPRVREASDDEDDAEPGAWMVPKDDPQEAAEDPMGLQRPADRDDQADPGELGDALSELAEARLVRTPDAPREVLLSEDPPPRTPGAGAAAGGTAVAYPEWDYRSGTYRPGAALVRFPPPGRGPEAWWAEVLARRAALVHRVRRRFERLRPRRERVLRQADGPEVDVAAWVDAFADRRAGAPGDDRLYQSVRPARREVAILLLVDVSASTDGWVSGDLRVVDVEKEALLVVCEALDALGDPYAVLAFSGEGPRRVDVSTVKRFDERVGAEVRGRIAALQPERYTRVGAAVRHATTVLMGRDARHRLLLILSDGKPNDVDLYEGRYGLEDTRQAVAEARLQGIHPFCLTVDRFGPAYLDRVFGREGYAVLHRPERLPSVLVELLRRIVRA